MAMNDIRLWHVTALWQRKDAHLKKEFIASAPTKEAAIKSAEGRLPINIRKADGYKTSARDLGTIKDNKIWFSSDVTSNAVIRIDDPSVTSELVDLFTVLWGEEIGWRSTNQSATEKDAVILNRLKNDKERRQLIPKWADECLQFPKTDPADFFRTKLSEYLGSDVKNIEDMIPVSDDEYDKIMSNARTKADKIINEARQNADDIRSQLAAETANLAKIAAALTGQMSWRNITSVPTIETIIEDEPVKTEPSNETIDQIDDEEPIDIIEDIPDVSAPQEEESNIDTLTDTPDDIEQKSADTDTADETKDDIPTDTQDQDLDVIPDENDDASNSIPDDEDNFFYEDDETSADDYFDDFPEDDDFDSYDGDAYDDDPPEEAFHIYNEEDFEPSIEDLLDQVEPIETNSSTTAEADDLISEQKAYEIMLSFKSEILMQALADLQIQTIDKKLRRKTLSPAEKTLNEAYPITPDMSESDKVAHLVEFISACEDKNGMPSLVYVYNKYAIPEDDNEVLE